ncbi:hypothetical protein LTR62_003629 [Meristemomyces frigidus]|uniref:Uncharacterized protein n=1 Tax=Meristemomyces frigidus TaxID=1508187 RepID=A0AAN7TJL5_9PEZI|nr:hypothetical protein LTR62_003629 [Meristemomyces frigidus]
MSPVPIALCGKSSSMAASFARSMLPEYEDAVHRELPLLLKGEAFKPKSDIGADNEKAHNAHTTEGPRKPRAIMVGAGFSSEELDDMRKVEGADQVPWLFPDPLKSAGSMLTGPFLMTVIVKRVKSCLQSHGIMEGKEGKANGGEVLSF